MIIKTMSSRKKLKKLSALLLSTVMISASFLSCGEKKPVDSGTTAPVEEATQPASEISAFDKEYNENQLEAIDFGGYEFKIYARGEECLEWQSQNAAVEEQNGELINDAVYIRNNVIEDKYNIKIKYLQAKTAEAILADVKKTVLAGTDAYDLALICLRDASAGTKQNLFLNLDEVPHINLKASWWDQSIMKDTSIMNKVYFATGDISIMDNDGTWTMMFNKKMLKDLNLEDPYQLVKDGKWTFAKFQEMMKGVTKDLDGNGTLDHLDQYGFATTMDTVNGLFYSGGLSVVTKNADDIPEYTLMQNPNTVGVLDGMYSIMRGNDYTLISADWAKVDPKTHLIVQAAFEESRSLFYAEVMQCVIRLRQMNTDFGVIPLPKYDEAQEGYYTTVHNWASEAAAIPASVSDPERTGIIVESLAMESKKYLTPAYYEIALKGKFIRDEESSEMLDIILSGRKADLGYMDNIGGLISDITSRIQGKKTDFVSTIEKKEAKVLSDIEKSVESYNGLE
ncbi:MAG: hypothetical protein AB9835_02600 [Eubacteriales bacterium]